jgi:hypothetical protein
MDNHPYPTNKIKLSVFSDPLTIRAGDRIADTTDAEFIVVDIRQVSDDDLEDLLTYRDFNQHLDTPTKIVAIALIALPQTKHC